MSEIHVDPDMEYLLTKYRWSIIKGAKTCYAYARVDGTPTYLHRLIMGLEKGNKLEVHHSDNNGLNCTRENMEVVTHLENVKRQNRRTASGYPGIYAKGSKWEARLYPGNSMVYLGIYDTLEEAIAIRNLAEDVYKNMETEI